MRGLTDRRVSRDDAPVVIALGPGHCAGVHCHYVIETNRALGMNSLDNSIAELFFNGMISREDAIAQAAYPEKLERALVA